MVTKRLPVNINRVNFYDGQRITEDEVEDEQNRNVGIDAANVANFLGSGIVKDAPIPEVIFDTNDLNTQQQTLFDGYSFDGSNVYIGTPLVSVSDEIQGVNLAITLSDVRLDGSASTSQRQYLSALFMSSLAPTNRRRYFDATGSVSLITAASLAEIEERKPSSVGIFPFSII